MARRSTLSNAQRKDLEKKIKAQPKIDFGIGGTRQPDGRPRSSNPGKSARERDAKAMTIETRVRHFGVTADQADTNMCGYPVGRLRLKGVIPERWLEAARIYATCAAKYYAAYHPEKPTPAAADLAKVRGIAGRDEEPGEARKLMVEWHDMETAAGDRMCRAVAYQVIVLDQEPTRHNIGHLIAALSNIAAHIGLRVTEHASANAEWADVEARAANIQWPVAA